MSAVAHSRIRSLFFWCHLTLGLTAGSVILMMCATGTLLVFRPQIQAWVDRDVRASPGGTATPLPLTALVSAVEAAEPESRVVSVTLERDPRLASTVTLSRGGVVYVNPSTGGVQGRPSARVVGFFQRVTAWHRYLTTSTEWRPTGRAVTGLANVAFVVLAASGLILWWPRSLVAQHLRPVIWFRTTSTPRARHFNWHNTIGFWCLPIILVMAGSGVVLSYRWASTLVYTLTGSPVPVAPAGGRAEGPAANLNRRADAPMIAGDSLDAAVATAQRLVPTWTQLSVRLPSPATASTSVSIVDGARWSRFARSQVIVGATGALVAWQPYDEQSAGQKARTWLRFAHTGEIGGAAGQVIAAIACLGGVMLVWTGISLSLRRFLAWRRRGAGASCQARAA